MGSLGVAVPLHFWRTHAGAAAGLVIDLLGGRVLIEIKLGGVSDGRELGGLRAAMEDLGANEGWVVAQACEPGLIAPGVTRVTFDIALERRRQSLR